MRAKQWQSDRVAKWQSAQCHVPAGPTVLRFFTLPLCHFAIRRGGPLLFALLLSLASCNRHTPDPNRTVVLYSSVDSDFLKLVLPDFEKTTGITVQLVGDTEATKSTGLVQRLIAEKDRPKADVWWSSEALGTIKLSRLGILEPYTSEKNEKDFPAGWPSSLRSKTLDWYAFAQRPRTLVYSTTRLKEKPVNVTAAFLAAGPRAGMARPQFGTCRGHMAFYCSQDPVAFTDWLASLHKNGLRLYTGNGDVVRAVANGEIDVGFTDYDDVIAGQALGYPVAAAFPADAKFPLPLTPNTAAIVKGAPQPALARQLLDYIISAQVEAALAASDSKNWPVRPEVAARFPGLNQPGVISIDWEKAADHAEQAMKTCDEVLGR